MKSCHSDHHTSAFFPLHAGAGFRLINHPVKPFSLTPWGQVWKKALPGSTFLVVDAAGWNIPIDIPHSSVVSPGWQSKMPGDKRKSWYGWVWASGAWLDPYWFMFGGGIFHQWRNVYSGVKWLKLEMAEPLSSFLLFKHTTFTDSFHPLALGFSNSFKALYHLKGILQGKVLTIRQDVTIHKFARVNYRIRSALIYRQSYSYPLLKLLSD